MEVDGATGWDQSVTHTVIVKKFASTSQEGGQVKVVGGCIARVFSVGLLDDTVIKVLPLPLRSAVEEVFHVVRSKVVGLISETANKWYPLGFAAQPEMREDKCLVCVDIIAVDLMEGVQLGRRET